MQKLVGDKHILAIYNKNGSFYTIFFIKSNNFLLKHDVQK